MNLLYLLPLLPLAFALPSPAADAGSGFGLKATNALTTYPFGAKMNSSIEGASIDKAGVLHAVNKTSLVNLATGKVLYYKASDAKDTTQQFSSSRKLISGGWLLGDAFGHKVFNIAEEGTTSEPPTAFQSTEWVQPNDIALTTDEKNFYFAGNNYTAGTGDVFYALDNAKTPVKLDNKGVIFRTNGIEVSADNSWLFVTNTKMKTLPETGIESAWVFKIALDKAGKPNGDWKPVIDLYAAAGKDAAIKDGLDPDGMRIDVAGWMYSTLNAHGKVLRWNTADPTKFELIDLETIQFPTNLEIGGKDGKTLLVIGRCKANGENSCVDQLEGLSAAGKEWSRLNSKLPKCRNTKKSREARKARKAKRAAKML